MPIQSTERRWSPAGRAGAIKGGKIGLAGGAASAKDRAGWSRSSVRRRGDGGAPVSRIREGLSRDEWRTRGRTRWRQRTSRRGARVGPPGSLSPKTRDHQDVDNIFSLTQAESPDGAMKAGAFFGGYQPTSLTWAQYSRWQAMRGRYLNIAGANARLEADKAVRDAAQTAGPARPACRDGRRRGGGAPDITLADGHGAQDQQSLLSPKPDRPALVDLADTSRVSPASPAGGRSYGRHHRRVRQQERAISRSTGRITAGC